MLSYIILGIAILFLVFLFSRFHPAATQQITEDLFAVRCGIVNFYVLITSSGTVLFDTGLGASMARRGLQKLGLSPDSVTHVFLTHSDFDHVGGLSAFPKAALYLCKAEEQMINGTTARRGFMHNRRLHSYHTMEDYETIVVGDTTIQLLLAPGHTPGSAVYRIGNHALISGDLLRLSRKGDVLPFLWLMNMNHREDIQSVKAIQPITQEVQYILTGHTGIFKTKL